MMFPPPWKRSYLLQVRLGQVHNRGLFSNDFSCVGEAHSSGSRSTGENRCCRRTSMLEAREPGEERRCIAEGVISAK